MAANGIKLRNLTLKQEKFVNEYIINNGNATAAVIAAGYKETANGVLRAIASQNLTKQNIINAIVSKRKELQAKTEITREKVLNDIEQQRIKADVKSDIANALRASELQGKSIALFVEANIDVNSLPQQNLSADDIQELRRLAMAMIQLRLNSAGSVVSPVSASLGLGQGQGKIVPVIGQGERLDMGYIDRGEIS